MGRVAAAFAPAQQSINWANDAIGEFFTEANAFFNRDATEIVVEQDAQTGENVQKLKLKHRLPGVLTRKATEALTNTRHAFDQAVFAARNVLGRASNESVYFPWAQSPTDLKVLLERRKIDQRLWSIFEAHQPYVRSDAYAGGDDIARVLASIANSKHTIGLTVNANITTTGFPGINARAVRSMHILIPRWDPDKNEAELVRWIGDVEMNGQYNFRFEIVLKDPRLSQPMNVPLALRHFSKKAQAVVEDLERRCGELAA